MTHVEMNQSFRRALVSEMNGCGERTPFLKPSVAAFSFCCKCRRQKSRQREPCGACGLHAIANGVCTERRPSAMAAGHVVCWNVTDSRAGNRRCHSCVSYGYGYGYGFRHLGPVSTNVLVISDPAMLIDGTPEETTFPRPRLSAQSQAKLLSPASACKWAPWALADERLGTSCDAMPRAPATEYQNCRRLHPRFTGTKTRVALAV
jgi:hypothetical protein